MRNVVQTIGYAIIVGVAIVMPVMLGLLIDSSAPATDKATLFLLTTTLGTLVSAFGGWLIAEAYHKIKE